MKQQTAILAALAAFAAAVCAPTATWAQPYYQPYYGPPPGSIPQPYGPRVYGPGIPPQDVMRIVRANGFIPLGPTMRRGPNYVVMATTRSGGQVRVVVNAMTGDIMRVNPRVGMRPYDAPYGRFDGPPPDGPGIYGPGARFDGGAPPVPPQGLGYPRTANAPIDRPPPGPPRDPSNPRSVTAPHAPPSGAGRTPIPRPRPQELPMDTTASAPAPTAPAPTKGAPSTGQPTPPTKTAPTQMVPVAPLDEI